MSNVLIEFHPLSVKCIDRASNCLLSVNFQVIDSSDVVIQVSTVWYNTLVVYLYVGMWVGGYMYVPVGVGMRC